MVTEAIERANSPKIEVTFNDWGIFTPEFIELQIKLMTPKYYRFWESGEYTNFLQEDILNGIIFYDDVKPEPDIRSELFN